jgi:hypothetical protein
MLCRPCVNRFWGLKYIPRLFSEYMQTFSVEEPMKMKTFDVMGPHQDFIYMLLTLKLLKLFRKPVFCYVIY